MKSFLCLCSVLALCLSAQADDSFSRCKNRATAALHLETLQRERQQASKDQAGEGYQGAIAQSVATGRPLVVLVGTERKDLDQVGAWIVFHAKSLEGIDQPAILISTAGQWVESLPPNATRAAVERAIQRRSQPPPTSAVRVPLLRAC